MPGATELTVRASVEGSVATITVAGEIDLTTRETFQAALLDAVAAGATHLVVDAAELVFMDSAGVASLVAAIERGATVTVEHAAPIVRRVLDLLAVEGLATGP